MSGRPEDEKKKAKAKKPRRLRRWLVRLVILAVALRIALALMLTTLVEYGVGFAGLEARCGDASLSLLGGSVRLSRVELEDPDGGPAALRMRVDELAADVSTWQLLFGELVISDAVLRGVDVELHRRADGSFALPAAWTATGGPAEEPPEEPADAGPPGFELPLAIATARIHDLRVRIGGHGTDRPPLEFVIDADVDDLGRRDVPGTVELRVASAGLPDRLVLSASVATPDDRLECDLTLLCNGLDLARVVPAAAGIAPLNVTLRAGLALAPAAGAPGSTTLSGFAELQRSPELASVLRAELQATFGADGRTELAADLRAEELALVPLRSLLQRAGVAIEGAGVDVAAAADLTVEADGATSLRVRDVRVGRDEHALALEELRVGSLRSTAEGLQVDSVELAGPTATLTRLPDGSLTCAGLRFGAGAPGAAEQAEPGAEPAAPAALPTVIVGSLAWRGAAFTYADLGVAGSPSLEVRDVTVTGSGLACACDRPPGEATIALSLPGVAGRLHAQLQLTPRPAGGALAAEVTGERVTLRRLSPWLEPAGITPVLEDGRIAFRVRADLRGDAGPELLSARVANLRLTDGDEVLAGLRNAELDDLDLTHGGLAFARLAILEPVVTVTREPAGTTVAGLRFAAAATADATDEAAAPAAPAAGAGGALDLATGPVELRGATLHVRRAGPDGARTTSVGFDAEVGAMAGAGRSAWAEPVPFELAVRLDQRVDALSLKGRFSRTEDRVAVVARLDGSGIRGTALDALLPAGIRSPLSDATLAAELEFGATDWQRDFALTLRQLRLRDRDQELAAIDVVEVRAPVLAADRLHVETLRVEGIRARVTATPDGLLVPGLLLATAPAEPPAEPAAEPAAANAVAPADTPIPAIRLGRVTLSGSEVTWTDRSGSEGEPVRASFRVELAEPWETAAELESTPPMRWQVECAASPVVGSATAAATLQPFAIAPTFDLEFQATGIDTTAITRIAPGLLDTVGGTETAAALRGRLHVELALARSRPNQFGGVFARPFGGTLAIEDLQLLATDGRPLVRVPALDAALRAFDPRTGDVLLRALELDSPSLQATRTPEGLAVAGLLLLNAPPPAAGEPQPQPLPPPTPPGAAPEFAIDDLRVYGLGFTWRDTTTEPATDLPVEELDLMVQKWSTRTLTESRRFAFRANARGGTLPLGRRVTSSSVLAGIAGATADLVTGAGNENVTERRPLFDELAINGHLQLFPRTWGRIETSVRRFELPALRGLASSGGVDLNDGVVDADVTLELDRQGADLRSLFVFTWLQVSEPAGGPISTYLKLPASLEVVLFALRNDDDEHRIPLTATVPPEGIGSGAIASSAIEALTLLIGEAIASTPLRAVRTLTDAVGLSGRDELDTEPAVLDYAPGGATAMDLAPLTPLLERVGTGPDVGFVLNHVLGAGDFRRAEELANPGPDVAARAVAELTRERDAIATRRARLAAEVQARLLAGQRYAARDQFEELRAIDRRLAEVQAALDGAAALFDGDSPRLRRRRARRAAVELAELRLEMLAEELGRRLGAGADKRIEIRPARAVVAEELAAGGRIVVTPRTRSVVEDRPKKRVPLPPPARPSPILVPDQRL